SRSRTASRSRGRTGSSGRSSRSVYAVPDGSWENRHGPAPRRRTVMTALTRLTAGMTIPFGGDRCTTVPAELAEAFRPGDRLHVVQATGDLLHVPAATQEAVTAQVDAAVAAFEALR